MSSHDFQFQDGIPYSTRHGDTYFSKDGGLAESRSVFLAGNDLAKRLIQTEQKARQLGRPVTFAILELGFGTGLNFAATLDLFHRLKLTGVRLDYWSIEKYPLSREQVSSVIKPLPLQAIAKDWTEHYSPPALGLELCYNLVVTQSIRLNLICYDASSFLQANRPKPYFHAVFLDGFAPRVNDGLWDRQVLLSVAKRCRPGATFATYTSARSVRNDLTQAGFLINRRPGFANKRHMLVGIKPGVSEKQTKPMKVAVVGAGLGGAATAHALAQRGINVTVFEKKDSPGQGASGNPRALIKPPVRFAYRDPEHLVSFFRSPQPKFALQAFLYAISQVQYLKLATNNRPDFIATPTIMVPPEEKNESTSRWDKQAGYKTATDMKGALDSYLLQIPAAFPSPLPKSGLQYLAQGGSLKPKALCETLLAHPLIELKTGHEITSLHRAKSWRLVLQNGNSENFDQVVFANSYAVNKLKGIDTVPVDTKWGRLWYEKKSSSKPLNAFFSHGYTVDAGGIVLIGSAAAPGSYDENEKEPDSLANSASILFKNAQSSLAGYEDINYPNTLSNARTSRRCQGSDHRPVYGAWPKVDWLRGQGGYQKLKQQFGTESPANDEAWLPGLYAMIGLGARGVIYSLYLGELLAGEINGEAIPATDTMRSDLNLYRFYLRDLRRGKL